MTKNASKSGETREQTAVPARNFTITTADRVNAIALHMPAYARRLRLIEDIQDLIVARLARVRDKEAKAHPADRAKVVAAVRADADLPKVRADLARVNELVDRHNQYYPWEKNLRIDLATRQYMDRGDPWRPMAAVTIEALLERVLG